MKNQICWSQLAKETELVSDILLWIPKDGHAQVG